MKQLPNNYRKAKEKNYEPQDAFNRWVEEIAVLKDLTIDEVLQLAIVRNENLEYTGEKK